NHYRSLARATTTTTTINYYYYKAPPFFFLFFSSSLVFFLSLTLFSLLRCLRSGFGLQLQRVPTTIVARTTTSSPAIPPLPLPCYYSHQSSNPFSSSTRTFSASSRTKADRSK